MRANLQLAAARHGDWRADFSVFHGRAPAPVLSVHRPLISRLVPAAGCRTHLLVAALVWTLVGVSLLIVGVRWIYLGDEARRWLAISLAMIIGLGKGIFVLRRTARRNIKRILARGDGRCIGGFVSWKMWIFILAMMAGGRLLRASDLPLWILGTIYAGIGLALASSSVTIWITLRGFNPDGAGSTAASPQGDEQASP